MSDVTLTVQRWSGDRAAEPDDENVCLRVVDVVVNGYSLGFFNGAKLDTEGFLSLEIVNPPGDLREQFTDPATYLMGTDTTRLLLPVTSLEVVA